MLSRGDHAVMDFEAFVITVWNYGTLTADGLRRFAFDIYDLDRGGTLETSEIKVLFAEVCGDDFAKSDRAGVLLQVIYTKLSM